MRMFPLLSRYPNRCETFELQDRVSEACEAFANSSPSVESKLAGTQRVGIQIAEHLIVL